MGFLAGVRLWNVILLGIWGDGMCACVNRRKSVSHDETVGSSESKLNTHANNGAFLPQGVDRFSLQRCGTGRVSTANSGRPGLSRRLTRLIVLLPLRY